MTAPNTEYRSYLSGLIKDAQSGESEALTKLITELYPKVQKQAAALLGSKDSDYVEDAVQDSMMKVIRNIEKVKNVDGFNAFVRTTVSNTVKDYWKSASYRNDVAFSDIRVGADDDADDLQYDPEDERGEYRPEVLADRKANKEIIMNVLNDIPYDQREVLVMAYMNDMSIKEIARELNIPESTVTGRLQKGKNKIKVSVKELEKREGIKLYGMAPLPFFLEIFRDWRGMSYLRGTAAGVITATTAAAGTAGTAGSAGTGSVAKTAGKITAKAVKGVTAVRAGVAAGTAVAVFGAGVAIHSYVASRLNEPVIGEVTVVADKVDIWKVPSTHSTDIGDAVQGVSYDVYEVLIGGSVWYPKDSDRYEDMEVISDKGYTWYRIDNNGWIADNGSWVTYTVK